MTLLTYDLLNQYRFLMFDFVHIMRRMPMIRAHYQELTLARREQFRFLINEFVKNGLIRPNLSERESDDWIALATLFGDFWLSNAAILYTGKEEDKVKYYVDLFMRLGIPYLTQEGSEALNAILTN